MIFSAALLLITATHDVNIVVAPPCLATFRASGRVGNIATEQAKKLGEKTATRALGTAALFSDSRIVLPDPDALDASAPTNLLGDDVKRTVLAESLPALSAPEELAFAMPGAPAGFIEGLLKAGATRGHSPDLELIHVRLVRLEKNGRRALSVEFLDGGASPAPTADGPATTGPSPATTGASHDSTGASAATTETNGGVPVGAGLAPPSGYSSDAFEYDRSFVGLVELNTHAGKISLVSAILTVGGPARLKPALDDARAKAGKNALTIMTGFVAGYPPRFLECMVNDAAASPSAVVPGGPDLVPGAVVAVEGFKNTGAVVLAANLDVNKDAAPRAALNLGRVRVLERNVEGVKVAVIGLVDPAVLDLVPKALRKDWLIEDPLAVLFDLVDKAMREPQPPDLVVVVTASRDLAQKLAVVPDVDIVIAGADGRTDALDTVTNVSVRNTAREQVREPSAMYTALGTTVGVRTVTAQFSDGAGGPALTGVVDDNAPTTGWSKRDMAFAKTMRNAEEADFVRDAPLLLPRLDDVLALNPDAAPLGKGANIAYRGQFTTLGDDDSPIWSDALFHRLVANTLKHAFAADAAFTSTTPRRSDLGNAAVARRFVKDWLAGKGNVRMLDIKGADLLRLSDAVNRQGSTQPAPLSWIYAAGVDVTKNVIGGRKIDANVTYHVIIDDKSAARPDVAAVLESVPARADFVPVSADSVVLEALAEKNADAASIAPLLQDEAQVLVPEWRLSVDAVDLHGTGGRSSDNMAVFAGTKEARAVQPAFAQLGAHALLGALYDDAAFAWESKLKLHYESILLVDVPQAQLQDQVDDVVLSTEGRLNSISLSGGAGEFRVVPFLQLAADSELTPVVVVSPPDPATGAVTVTTLARQMLVRESLGIAAYPGGPFKEVRTGLIVQQDASDALDHGGPVRNDIGVGAESHLAFPLWKLLLTSDIDARYFIPDGDDTPNDLALRAQLVHKLVLPVTQTTAVFTFLDVIVLYGKKGEATRAPGLNAIAGAGITFSDLWRL